MTAEPSTFRWPDEPVIDAKQVAEGLKVSDDTVRRWAKEGLLPTVSLPQGKRPIYRFPTAQIRAMVEGTPNGEIA